MLSAEQRKQNTARVKERYHTVEGVREATIARAKAWEKANRPRRLLIEQRYHRSNPEKYMLKSSISNAKKRNLEHSLTIADITIPDMCPVFKVPFEPGTRYAPSLDRIDNAQGYVPGNIQVISRRANAMKLDATENELRMFAEWVLS